LRKTARFIACFKFNYKASSTYVEFIIKGSTGFCIRPANPKESHVVKSYAALASEIIPYLIFLVSLVLLAKVLKLLRFIRGLK
jgi:hypothetical protein